MGMRRRGRLREGEHVLEDRRSSGEDGSVNLELEPTSYQQNAPIVEPEFGIPLSLPLLCIVRVLALLACA